MRRADSALFTPAYIQLNGVHCPLRGCGALSVDVHDPLVVHGSFQRELSERPEERRGCTLLRTVLAG